MTHYGNIEPLEASIVFYRGYAIVEVAERLRKAVRRFAARFHTARVVVCEHKKAVSAELFYFFHISAVSAAKAVVKNNEPSIDRRIVLIKVALKLMTEGGFEGLGHFI